MTYKIVSKSLPYIFVVLLSFNTNLYNPGSSKSQETHSESSRSRDYRKRKRKEDSKRKNVRHRTDDSPPRHESKTETIARLRKERNKFKKESLGLRKEKDEVETKSEVFEEKLNQLKKDNERLLKEKDEFKDESHFWKNQYDESKPKLFFSYKYDSDGKMTCEELAIRLAELIKFAENEICIAVYDFNNSVISDALIKKAVEWRQQRKDINILIIIDSNVFWKKGEIAPCERATAMINQWLSLGISVRVFDHILWKRQVSMPPLEDKLFRNRDAIIHYKEAIIDNIVWIGSKNFTKAGNTLNQEHVIITEDPEIRKKACDNFYSLWKFYCKEYQVFYKSD